MSDITLGIIGGGQLGSMLAIAAKKLNVKTIIFLTIQMPQLRTFVINLFQEIMMTRKKLVILLIKLML